MTGWGGEQVFPSFHSFTGIEERVPLTFPSPCDSTLCDVIVGLLFWPQITVIMSLPPVLVTRKSIAKFPLESSGKKKKKRGDFDHEQVVCPPLPIPLKRSADEDSPIVWPLNKPFLQPIYVGRFNHSDACVDIFDQPSVQSLYLLGFFGKGSHSRHAPVYKLKKKKLYHCESSIRQSHTDTSSSSLYQQPQFSHRRSPPKTRNEVLRKQNQSLRQALESFAPVNKGDLVRDLYGNSEVSQQTGPSSGESIPLCGSEHEGESSSSDSDKSSDVSKVNSEKKETPEILKLSMEEAVFLSYGLGILTVKQGSDDPVMSIDELWVACCRAAHPTDFMSFPASYAAYHFFRSRGWVVKCGYKFGSDFVLYKEGPPFYHALFSITIIRVKGTSREPTLNWQHLSGLQRMSHGVHKEPVLCHVIIPDELAEDSFRNVAVIQKMQVHCVHVDRWIPNTTDHEQESKVDWSTGKDWLFHCVCYIKCKQRTRLWSVKVKPHQTWKTVFPPHAIHITLVTTHTTTRQRYSGIFPT